jgi:hypothetical protein
MLKVFVTIDCDLCGQPFKRVAASADRDPMSWRALADDVEYHAGNSGWLSRRSAHHCDWCVHHAMTAGREAGDDIDEDDF